MPSDLAFRAGRIGQDNIRPTAPLLLRAARTGRVAGAAPNDFAEGNNQKLPAQSVCNRDSLGSLNTLHNSRWADRVSPVWRQCAQGAADKTAACSNHRIK